MQAFATTCLSPAQIDIEPLQTLFLDTLNRLRNTVANGNLHVLPPAARMPTVAWSSDLAYTATLNTKNCKFIADCHNSRKSQLKIF